VGVIKCDCIRPEASPSRVELMRGELAVYGMLAIVIGLLFAWLWTAP
jgi:hypothetical protein